MVARAPLMGRMLRKRRSVLSAWASWLVASLLCLTAAATSSASDASSHGQSCRWFLRAQWIEDLSVMFTDGTGISAVCRFLSGSERLNMKLRVAAVETLNKKSVPKESLGED